MGQLQTPEKRDDRTTKKKHFSICTHHYNGSVSFVHDVLTCFLAAEFMLYEVDGTSDGDSGRFQLNRHTKKPHLGSMDEKVQ